MILNMDSNGKKLISILIPAYNEHESLPPLYDRLVKLMDSQTNYDFEVLFVNDGSKDNTLDLIKFLRKKDTRINYVNLSRNYGKEVAMAAGFERIYESGPVFRAEKFASRKHATEFTGFDLEFSYIESYKDVMHLEEEMLTYALQAVKDKYGEEIKRVYDIDVVVPTMPFPVIDLHDLYDELEKRYGYKVPESEKGDLTTEGERLCQKFSMDAYGHEFLFVTGYSKENRAFYHMRDEKGVPCGYDLIWKGCEITTGAQREHRYEILKAQAEEKGLGEDVKFYLDFFRYGCPPHGGFGIGVDRITMLIFNEGIKESMFIFRGPDRLNP